MHTFGKQARRGRGNPVCCKARGELHIRGLNAAECNGIWLQHGRFTFCGFVPACLASKVEGLMFASPATQVEYLYKLYIFYLQLLLRNAYLRCLLAFPTCASCSQRGAQEAVEHSIV